jgi:hypothetical protein
MGEIAEMMLDGTLCECCGEFIEGDGEGFPRYCSAKCAGDRGAMPTTNPIKANRKSTVIQANGRLDLSEKLFKRLKHLAMFGTADGSPTPKRSESMYAGDIWEGASKQYEKLANRGFVERRSPHNMAHKDRAVITQAGLDFLDSRGVKP